MDRRPVVRPHTSGFFQPLLSGPPPTRSGPPSGSSSGSYEELGLSLGSTGVRFLAPPRLLDCRRVSSHSRASASDARHLEQQPSWHLIHRLRRPSRSWLRKCPRACPNLALDGHPTTLLATSGAHARPTFSRLSRVSSDRGGSSPRPPLDHDHRLVHQTPSRSSTSPASSTSSAHTRSTLEAKTSPAEHADRSNNNCSRRSGIVAPCDHHPRQSPLRNRAVTQPNGQKPRTSHPAAARSPSPSSFSSTGRRPTRSPTPRPPAERCSPPDKALHR